MDKRRRLGTVARVSGVSCCVGVKLGTATLPLAFFISQCFTTEDTLIFIKKWRILWLWQIRKHLETVILEKRSFVEVRNTRCASCQISRHEQMEGKSCRTAERCNGSVCKQICSALGNIPRKIWLYIDSNVNPLYDTAMYNWIWRNTIKLESLEEELTGKYEPFTLIQPIIAQKYVLPDY